MLLIIEEKTADFLKTNKLLPLNAKVLLAVSGGADSVALLYILKKIHPNALHIAHINHQLRGSASLKDEKFVKSLADKLNLPITVQSVDVKSYAKKNKLSIETAARKLRLAALCRIADKNNCRFIATAHHKNDNAETVIHRLLRGTGYKGLAGIRPATIMNGKTFIRPLLCLTRQEIEEYLKKQNISWQSDYTNLDCRFTRNRIRHKVLPYLEQSTPNLIELIGRLSEHSVVLAGNIEKNTKAVRQTCFIARDKTQITIDLKKFQNQSQPIQVELIQTALANLGLGLQKYTSKHYRKIIEFAKNAAAGKTLTAPLKIKIIKGYGSFFINISTPKKDESNTAVLNVPGKTIFENCKIETEILDNFRVENIKNKKDNFTEWFDYEQIKFPLIARHRQKGDKFAPFGQEKFKKIGKFLTAQKINFDLRKRAFLICDSEKILWLVPIRRSNNTKIDNKSRKILKISVSKTS